MVGADDPRELFDDVVHAMLLRRFV